MGVKLTAEEFLYVHYDPLSLGFVIKEIGGGIKQVYYADSNQYVPNRSLAPLILVPEIQVVDPDKIIPYADIASQLVAARWYLNSVTSASQVTVYEDDPGGNTADFALSRTYKSGLVVRKNVPQTQPVSLFFQGEYYDSRRGSNILITGAALLTSTSNAESVAAPVVILDKPSSWIFNPLKGIAKHTINAFMFRGGNQVPNTNIAFFWYKVKNGVESLIDTAKDLFYVSGKNANGTWNSSIVVDPDYMEKTHIRCRADYFEGTRPTSPTQGNMAETVFKRRFPHSLKAELIIRTGDLVKSDVNTIIAEAQVKTNGSVISNPGRFFFFRWYRNTMTSGSQAVEIGHGEKLTLSRNEVFSSSNVTSPKISFEMIDHGAYEELTDKNGQVLTTKDGEVLTGF